MTFSRMRKAILGYAGPALALAGVVAIVVATGQTLSTGDIRLQMQQIMSGGIGGLALMVAGVTLWLLHHLGRTRSDIEALKGAVQQTESTAVGVAQIAPVTTVIATKESFHAEGCVLLGGKRATRTLPIDDALASGLTPCGLCLRQIDQR